MVCLPPLFEGTRVRGRRAGRPAWHEAAGANGAAVVLIAAGHDPVDGTGHGGVEGTRLAADGDGDAPGRRRRRRSRTRLGVTGVRRRLKLIANHRRTPPRWSSQRAWPGG